MARRVSAARSEAIPRRGASRWWTTKVLIRVLLQMVASASCSVPAGPTTPAESRVRPTSRLLLDQRPKTTAQRRRSAGGASRCATTRYRWARARTRNRGEMMAARNDIRQHADEPLRVQSGQRCQHHRAPGPCLPPRERRGFPVQLQHPRAARRPCRGGRALRLHPRGHLRRLRKQPPVRARPQQFPAAARLVTTAALPHGTPVTTPLLFLHAGILNTARPITLHI